MTGRRCVENYMVEPRRLVATGEELSESIEGSDLETLENNRKALEKVRSERAR